MPALENLQWEAFCQRYLVDFNGTQAAIEVGYSPGEDNDSARSQAPRLLANSSVQARLAELLTERINEFKMEAVSVLKELQRIASCNVKLAYNERGALKPIHDIPDDVARCIAAIEVEELWEGRGENREQVGVVKKIKFWDKNKGLELLGKHFKLWMDKLELSAEKSLQDLLTQSWGREEA
jgi:phage terminase small subunit